METEGCGQRWVLVVASFAVAFVIGLFTIAAAVMLLVGGAFQAAWPVPVGWLGLLAFLGVMVFGLAALLGFAAVAALIECVLHCLREAKSCGHNPSPPAMKGAD